MPKSVTIPVVVSVIALFVYFAIYRNANPPLTTPAYVTFTLDVFNFCTIVALFVILSLHEQTTPAQFGNAMRTNIPTVVAALLINLVYSAKNIWDTLILKIVS
jgi:hypothetical protein